MKQIRDADALCAWIVAHFGETAQVADVIRVIEEMAVDAPPAVPGCTDLYNLSELCFRNGEANMKGKVVAMVMGLQVTANSEQQRILTDLLDKLKHI